ncbi:hypothetical protein E4K10_18020 [Streptomyces sp. T1317-0309]|nr:hypothetical protein E4K10_18020 [Streptomyces sp. T1317-0309]
MLAAGLTAGLIGLLSHRFEITWSGVFLAITAVPLLIVRKLNDSTGATAAQLAEAHNTGYRLALDHVARGLLDQHAAPTGPGTPAAPPGNVIQLRPPVDDEREAL